MQLEEPFYELDRVKLKRWLPWLHLFRAFRLAVRPKAILLGCLAILLLDAGREIVERLPFSAAWADAYNGDRSVNIAGFPIQDLAVNWTDAFSHPIQTTLDSLSLGRVVVLPITGHVTAARHLFSPGTGVTGTATAISLLLMYLFVWSICGVGISRMAATTFAAETATNLQSSVRYSLGKLTSSMGAAIVPLLAIITLWVMTTLFGLLGRIPGIGEALIGIGWGIALLCGFGMAIILLGLAAGWPLMLCSVAVEDADAFDAFGRIYNYLFARPWYGLWLLILTLLYGSALTIFASTVLQTTHGLAEWAVSSGLGYDRLSNVIHSPGKQPGFPTTAVEIWRNIAGLILHGFIVSYFWTAATIVYMLLRKSEDATPLDTVTLPNQSPPGDQELPLVGVPAAEKREEEAESGGSDESEQPN